MEGCFFAVEIGSGQAWDNSGQASQISRLNTETSFCLGCSVIRSNAFLGVPILFFKGNYRESIGNYRETIGN